MPQSTSGKTHSGDKSSGKNARQSEPSAATALGNAEAAQMFASGLFEGRERLGNRRFRALLRSAAAPAHDSPYEREADRIAEQVLQAAAHPAVASAPPHIQRYAEGSRPRDGSRAVDAVPSSSGSPLEPALRQDMEQRFGRDLSRVRVHTGPRAEDSARSLNALAYTVGQDVVFAAGKFQPHSETGRKLIAHELVHTLQQGDAHELIQRKGAGGPSAAKGEPKEMPPITLEIKFPGWVWFTYIDGRFLIRIQADWLAHHVYGVSEAESDRLFRERRWPNIGAPSLPAELFIGELESRTGLRLLPEARAELTARRRIPLEKYPDFHYAAFIEETDLIRWFGPDQWATYLRGEVGLAAPGAADADALAAHPLRANRDALAGDAELATVYLVLMEHFTGLVTTPTVEAMATNGLSAEELKEIIGDNAERGVLTDLFAQAWSEYRAAGGEDRIRFLSLAERILEQYQRGNITARANLLRVGKGGWPESQVLGIIHRNNNTLLYDAMGMPMRGIAGVALRDAGFIGFDPPAGLERAAKALQERGLAPKVRVGEALTINQFGQAFGAADSAMVAQAADAALRNSKDVGQRVKKGLAAEVLRVLGETAVFLAVFMIGHAFARFLIRTGNAISMGAGALLEVLLRTAGYIMGLSFLADTWQILLRAAFHMSRVRNDASGRPTRLSEVHMDQAARPIQQLIANAAAIMGTWAFGKLIKRVKAGKSKAEWADPKAPLRELRDTGSKTDAPELTDKKTAPAEEKATTEEKQATTEEKQAPAEEKTAATEKPPDTDTGKAPAQEKAPPTETAQKTETVPATDTAKTPVSEKAPAIEPAATPAPEKVTATATPKTPAPKKAPAAEAAKASKTDKPSATDTTTGAAGAQSTRVWVNTKTGRYHMPGSRYYGKTKRGTFMPLDQAQAEGYVAVGAKPPSGTYFVQRPTEGDPRVVIKSWIGEGEYRANLEDTMMSASQYAAAELRGFQRAHSQGAGLGVESAEAIRLASELVNQTLQNRGIEQFMRDLRDFTEEGERLRLTTETKTHPRTLRLQSIHYVVERAEGDRLITLFEAAIEMRPDGSARAGVRLAGSDAYTFGPWFQP